MHSVLAAVRTETAAQAISEHAAGLGVADTVRTAVSAEQTLAELVEWSADVVLINSAVVGLEYARFTKRVHHLSPVASVVLVGVADARMAATAIAAGVEGVVRSCGDGDELVSACVRGLLDARADGMPEIPRQRANLGAHVLHPVSRRELEVLRAMTEGFSNAEIGRRLFITEDTVKTHARRIYRKLGARDRAHAVAAAFRAGLVE